MLLQYAFMNCREGVFRHTRSDGKLFNIARLRAKTKVTKVLIREMLFADDAAVVSHTEEGLQQLVSRLSHACKEFGLKISLKKTNVMAQDAGHPPTIAIDRYNLEVVENFTYLGSTISNSLSIDVEVSSRIAKAVAVMACVLSTLLYGSESWTTYARHEKKLNSFHQRCLRCILHIKWQDKISNMEVLERANMRSIYTILCERRLHWLGHVKRMDPGRIPKDLLYGELVEGSRHAGRPKLRFKDVCKRDMKRCNIDSNSWESILKPILETNCQARCKVCRRGTDHSRLRQEEQTEGTGQISPAANSFLLHQMWQRLPLTSWSAQPFKEVQIGSNYGATPSSPETDGCRRRRRRPCHRKQ